MRPWLALLCLGAAACYTPHFEECLLQCGAGCPSGWRCGGDGFCHSLSAETAACKDDPPATPDGGDPDGGQPDGQATPDASEPDGAVATSPDAGCTRTNLLANGNFDQSIGEGADKTVPGWTITGATPGAVVRHTSETVTEPNSPEYSAWLTRHNADHKLACQPIAIPTGTTKLEVELAVNVFTSETTATIIYDEMKVEIRTAGNVPREMLVRVTNLDAGDGWQGRAGVATMDFAGETVSFCLDGRNDPFEPTSIVVDDISLHATVCP
jgi:hypothetical protein